MTATESFFQWWFTKWGIGGWVVFLIVAVAAIAWLIYDAQTRRIRAVGWLMGAILSALLLLPSAYYALSPGAQVQMQDLQEVFFYLGLIGGIVPLVVAVGYGITYQGMRGCEKHGPYDASQPECPVCAQERQEVTPPPPPPPPPVDYGRREVTPPPSPPPPTKLKANAWLVDEQANRTYQLNKGDTRVGRSKQANDIVFTDKSVSREHMLIREERDHFTIYDRGARTGTYVNGRRLEGPMLLAHDDAIEIGDTRLRFITSRR
jgi:hypothetical protein